MDENAISRIRAHNFFCFFMSEHFPDGMAYMLRLFNMNLSPQATPIKHFNKSVNFPLIHHSPAKSARASAISHARTSCKICHSILNSAKIKDSDSAHKSKNR